MGEASYVDRVNALCAEFGCPLGAERLPWLYSRLLDLQRASYILRAFAKEGIAALDENQDERFTIRRSDEGSISSDDIRDAIYLVSFIQK